MPIEVPDQVAGSVLTPNESHPARMAPCHPLQLAIRLHTLLFCEVLPHL